MKHKFKAKSFILGADALKGFVKLPVGVRPFLMGEFGGGIEQCGHKEFAWSPGFQFVVRQMEKSHRERASYTWRI